MKIWRHISLLLVCFAGAGFCQASKWVPSGSWSGNGLVQTRLIPLYGEKWKIRGSSPNAEQLTAELIDQDGKILCSYIKYGNSGTPLSSSGKIKPEWKNAYLRIQGSGNGWKLSLEQYVDDVAGFKLYRALQTQIPVTKYGMWTGDGGDEKTIQLSIPAAVWRLRAEALDKGRLTVEVTDSRNVRKAGSYSYEPGITDTWFYGAGDYTIKVSSVAAPWIVSVELE